VLAHSKFKNFIHQSMLQETDMKQIDTFLKCLTQADPSFKNRRLVNRNVHEKGYVWQTEVRFDFQLFGSILFVDRLGRSLNKGLDVIGACHAFGGEEVCICSEARAKALSVSVAREDGQSSAISGQQVQIQYFMLSKAYGHTRIFDHVRNDFNFVFVDNLLLFRGKPAFPPSSELREEESNCQLAEGVLPGPPIQEMIGNILFSEGEKKTLSVNLAMTNNVTFET
jgi:hypothetical protein